MSTTTDTGTDARTIAAAWLEEIESAWNRADGSGFAESFTEDAEFVDIRGSHHRGVTAIAQGHQAIFDTIYAGSTVRYQVEVARSIAPDTVLAVAGATLEAPTGPLRGINHARFTAVLTHRDGRWAATAFHNTLVAVPPS
jgi:uncharacterized protein (TIGR02246 family)